MFEKALPIKRISIDTQYDESGSGIQPMVLTVTELQKVLCLSRKTVYDLVNQPGFPSFRVGSRILINRAALQRWLDKQTEQKQIGSITFSV